MGSNHVFTEDLHQEMGLMTSYRWAHEPSGLLFMLARYKFIRRMLDGYDRILEVGCGDGCGARLVSQVVGKLTCIDIDAAMIESAQKCHGRFGIDFKCTDEIEDADAIYSLDVMEHIEHEESKRWLGLLAAHAPVVIVGTPSLEAQPYASQLSRENHINCLHGADLKRLMKEHFRHVFMFAANDEMVHTGNFNMAHYNIAMGIN